MRDRLTRSERGRDEELETLLEILEAITSSIDLQVVTRTIVEKTALIVPVTRCSMLFIDEAHDRCYVIASHDDPEVHMLEIDLRKYPEVRQAIETRRPVLIQEVADDPLMKDVAENLGGLDLHSIMVIPMVFGSEVLGTLCMKTSRVRHDFTPREIRFCTAVARASANALKHALSYREVREESRRQRQSSEKLTRIFDSSPGLILTTDGDGRITSLNVGAEKLLGYCKDDLLGQPCRMLFEDDGGRGLVDRLRSSPTIRDWNCSLRDRRGHPIEVELHISALTDETGETSGSVWVGRDVTELRATQTQLLQAKKLSTIGEVISGVAHELNNPLSGVLGFTQLLLARAEEDGVSAELEMIHDSALRCQRIVQNLLSFARETKAAREYQDVNAVIEKSIEMKRYQLRVNGIEVVCELDPDLPRTLVDFQQLQQVLLNLFNNAQHALLSARKPEGPKLHVRSSLTEDAIVIEVTDNGAGMDQETIERVFDPFFTTKDPGKGTGLGLSVSYGIVREHGGRIWARGQKGVGSTFLIELPVRRESGDATPDPSEERPASRPTIRTGSRILVVDDEPLVLQLFVNLFEGRGYKIDTALHGKEACDMIARKQYDLVVTDVRMPEMNGIELYPRILERRPELKGRVVFITGDLLDGDTARFLSDPEIPVLTKPIEIRKVVEIVDRILARPTPAYTT